MSESPAADPPTDDQPPTTPSDDTLPTTADDQPPTATPDDGLPTTADDPHSDHPLPKAAGAPEAPVIEFSVRADGLLELGQRNAPTRWVATDAPVDLARWE